MTREVHVVVPAGIDDLAVAQRGQPSTTGASCQGLAATGWDVRERAVPGGWPRPDATARAGLATALAARAGRRGRARRRAGGLRGPRRRRPRGAPARARRARAPAARRRDGGAAGAGGARAGGPGRGRGGDRHQPVGGAPGRRPARAGPRPGHGRDARASIPHRSPPARDGSGACCASARSPRRRARTCWSRRSPRSATCRGPATLVGPLRDPGHVDAVRAAIERHGLAGRVRLTGPLTGAALDAAYAARRPARGAVARGDLRDGRHRGAGPGHPGARERRGRAAGDARPRPGGPRAGDGRPGRSRCGPRCRAARLVGRPGPAGGAPALARSGVGACCTDGR